MKILHYVCVYECVSHSFIIWAGSSTLYAQRHDPVTVAEPVCQPATAIIPLCPRCLAFAVRLAQLLLL